MLVEIERRPVLEVPYTKVTETAIQMRDNGLPAFVIRNASDSMVSIENGLYKAGYHLDGISKLTFVREEPTENSAHDDRDFHTDRSIIDDGHAPIITTHETTEGAVEATFIELPYYERSFAGDLDPELIEAIEEGKVDDVLAEPVLYAAELTVGDMVVMRLGGKKQLAHRYRTITRPRRSVTWDWHTNMRRNYFPAIGPLIDELS